MILCGIKSWEGDLLLNAWWQALTLRYFRVDHINWNKIRDLVMHFNFYERDSVGPCRHFLDHFLLFIVSKKRKVRRYLLMLSNFHAWEIGSLQTWSKFYLFFMHIKQICWRFSQLTICWLASLKIESIWYQNMYCDFWKILVYFKTYYSSVKWYL